MIWRWTSLFALACFSPGLARAENLHVHINAQSSEGVIAVAAFLTPEDFEAGRADIALRIPAVAGAMVITLPDLAPGTYGIAAYHDENGNGELDGNLIGYPVEPFGFANNPRLRFGPPDFQDFSVVYEGTPIDVPITWIN